MISALLDLIVFNMSNSRLVRFGISFEATCLRFVESFRSCHVVRMSECWLKKVKIVIAGWKEVR